MGLSSNGSFATVWSVEDRGKYAQVSLSISKKDKLTGEYTTEYTQSYANFVGKAYELAKTLKRQDRIKITEFEVRNCDKEGKRKQYDDLAVFAAERQESYNAKTSHTTTKVQSKSITMPEIEESDEDVPF